jgi:hypothetical protein
MQRAMKPVLYMGSGGTVGDLLLSSHYMYHQHVLGREVSVAIPKALRNELKDLYKKHTFLKSVVELEDFLKEPYLKYCADNGFEHSLHFEDVKFIREVEFHPLRQWFQYSEKPNIEPGCIGIHVTSSTNYDRPKVTHLDIYLSHCWNCGYKVAFLGTQKDEELFNSLYPDVKAKVPENLWRFGKDSLLQTMANLGDMIGLIVFSSWTSYAALLQGVPVIEMFSMHQWQIFSTLINQMMGRPVHYSQVCFWDSPSPWMASQIFPKLKEYAKAFYGEVF